MKPTIGVVIPARNEEALIRGCLESLHPFFEAHDPIVVVDACSDDRTVENAKGHPAQIVKSPKAERGRAIAFGIEHLLRAEPSLCILLVIHADMTVHETARARLIEFLKTHPTLPGGSLGHRIEAKQIKYRLMEWGNAFRARWMQMPYGDQAQFFRVDALRLAGGFPEQDTLEDVELSLRLRTIGRLVYLGGLVSIPTRHWKDGLASTTLRNWKILKTYRNQKRDHSYPKGRVGQ